MKNDAKLGMLAGVLGVIVAAALFAQGPPPAPSRPRGADTSAQEKAVKSLPAPPPTTASDPRVSTAALPSTPVVRTRKDVDARPASRAGADEEP